MPETGTAAQERSAPPPLLTVEGVYAGYGRGDIIHDVDISVHADEIVTIIGPNGAGKSTLIKAIAGIVQRRAGSIRIREDGGDGTEIGGLRASEVARHGLAYVPQEGNVFRSLSVYENLEMGAWIDKNALGRRLERVYGLFPVLQEKRRVRAGNLSGGQRQMVAFAMALMVEPRVLLLDEPSSGLSPVMVEQMFTTVRDVAATGLAVLMVEQNAKRGLEISNRGYVMASGQVALEGPADELLASREVSELYLGTRD